MGNWSILGETHSFEHSFEFSLEKAALKFMFCAKWLYFGKS